MGSQCEDIELRIRMKLSKCKRYKTFQEDSPRRKYPLGMPYYSIHRLKLLTDDDSHLNKASQTIDQVPIEKEKEVISGEQELKEIVAEEGVAEENVAEENSELIKATTGMFRDNKRRIDIVLVVEDEASTNTDSLKFDFLTNILRTGLEIEIEPGQMEVHKNLYFINIHAPDTVLNEYGNMFAVKRYFVNNRLASNNIYSKNHETEWLKIIRSNYTIPDGYSNYERSLIVYKILRHLPFGDHVNQYGLHRLLKRKIILDAYALHDGPYFYTWNKTARGANGRQILYSNWVGLRNVFQGQPLHVIHEYFGPKIAFYYAFYGFYNAALMLASIAGIVSVLMPYIANKEPVAMKQLCTGNKTMCPECFTKRCPRRPLQDYCIPIAINVHLDQPYTIYFSIFMIFWAFTFVAVWRRKEYVLNWIWEIGRRDSYYVTSRRPQFKINYKTPRSFTYDESRFYKVIRSSLSTILMPLCLVASLAIMNECKIMYDSFADLFITKEKPTKMREYLVLAIFEVFHTLIISVLEILFHFLCYYIVDFENHKSYNAYEVALITKQFAFSITLIYPFMCFFAWLVGNQNIFYGRCQFESWSPVLKLFYTLHKWLNTPWHYITINYYTGPDCFKYCWPFTCINEVSILLIVMLFLKQVVFRVIFNNNYRLTTDYNEARKNTRHIPCWEREYKLYEFSEAQLTRKYMILAVQFTLITLFVIAFPLAPLVVLVVNAWEIRHSAWKLLLASRRPLLIRSPGIGAWNNILLLTAYVAIVTNFLTLVLTTKQNLREFFGKPLNNTLLNFLLSEHKVVEPPLSQKSTQSCFAPYLLIMSKDVETGIIYQWTGLLENHATKKEYYWLNIVSCKVIFIGLCVLCLAFITQYIFKPYRRDIDKTRAIENKITNLYSHYGFIENEKNKVIE